MKILLISEYFYPQSSGGTELYVYNLALALQNQQHEVTVLSASDSEEKQILYKGLKVKYASFNHDFRAAVISGAEPADNLKEFLSIINNIKPDIIHFHTLTPTFGIHHIAAVKQAGFKIVLTSHIVSHTCIRGSLMRLGKFICDGKVEEKKCLSCYLQHRGLPEPINYLAADIIHLTNFPKNIARIVTNKQNELQKLRTLVDCFVVVSNWQREVFIKNEFDPQKIRLCRQTVERGETNNKGITPPGKLIIGFIGRITAIKGLHILLNALKQVATAEIELRVAAIPVAAERAYYDQQKQQAETLPNLIWTENIPNEKVGSFLRELDILCVPSQTVETGPFVVYEALAEGIPVLGSNLGGMTELILEGKNGWLFPHQDKKYLKSLIASFIIQKSTGKLLQKVEAINRPIAMLTAEMLEIYQNL